MSAIRINEHPPQWVWDRGPRTNATVLPADEPARNAFTLDMVTCIFGDIRVTADLKA